MVINVVDAEKFSQKVSHGIQYTQWSIIFLSWTTDLKILVIFETFSLPGKILFSRHEISILVTIGNIYLRNP